MSAVVCRLLGPVDVRIAGKAAPQEILWRKNIALLAYMARAPGYRRTREHLIGLLWPDKVDAAARQSLREAIRVVRRGLGAEVLKTAADMVELDPHKLDFDIERLLEVETTNPVAAAGFIRGDFLEGFAVTGAPEFERWLGVERLHWRQRSVDVLLRAASVLLNESDLRGALDRASSALKLEPGSDAAARMTMRALALLGYRSGALAVYDQFVTHILDLGAAPDRETEDLARRVKDGRVWSVEPPSASHARIRRPPLIGRSQEATTTFELWEKCSATKTAVAVVTEADSGLGKTRLAQELLERARLDGAVVASVRGIPADADVVGGGLIGLAAHGLLSSKGVGAADAVAVGAICRHVPPWMDAFPDAPRDDNPMSVPDALTEVLRRVLEEEPVCLCLDDAYWFDDQTLDWVHKAMRDLERTPLFLWVNTSPAHPRDQLDELRKRIGHEVSGVSFSLAPFDEEGVSELVQHAMGAYSAEQRARLTRRIMADSAGIPLLAVELLHAVESGMELEDGPQVWPTSKRTLSQSLPSDLPEPVVAAIRVGFRVLSKPAQETLRVVAVLGEGATVKRIGIGANLESAQLDEALDELEWERWLETDGRGYTFVARIVRDVVLQDMVTAGHRHRIERRASDVEG